MAYMCGSNIVAEGTICSDGSPAKWVPSGNPQPPSSVSTDNLSWNADTRPVNFGHRPTATNWSDSFGGLPGSPEKTTTVSEGAHIIDSIYAAAHAPGASRKDKRLYASWHAALEDYTGSDIGTRGSLASAMTLVLKDAASAGINVTDLLFGGGAKGTGSSSNSSGGGGGSAAPTLSGQQMHRVADQAMQTFAGREATNAEAKAVTKKARAQLNNPNMDPTFMAEEFAKNTPEATTYAANNYMKVFLQSLGGLGG